MLDKERKVSFVIPAYNEEESLEELYSLIKENVDDCKKENLLTDYEVLFIDDGSTDHTQDVIRKMSGQDEHVRYIFFGKISGNLLLCKRHLEMWQGMLLLLWMRICRTIPANWPVF